MKLQARNFVVRKPETIDITMFFKKFCIATRTKKRDTRENLVSFFMPCDRRVFTDLGIGKKKINRDDWRPAHLQYEGYYQAGQHQGA